MKTKALILFLVLSLILNFWLFFRTSSREKGSAITSASFPVQVGEMTFFPDWMVFRDPKSTFSGHVLMSVGREAVLINEKGEVRKQWKTERSISRVLLTQQGDLVYSSRELPSSLQRVSKDGNVLWTYPRQEQDTIDWAFDIRNDNSVFVIHFEKGQSKCNEIREVDPLTEKVNWKFDQVEKIFGKNDCQIFQLQYLDSVSTNQKPMLLIGSVQKLVLLEIETKKVAWEASIEGRILHAEVDQAQTGVLILSGKNPLSTMGLVRAHFADNKIETVIENLGIYMRGSMFSQVGPYQYLFFDAGLRVSEVQKDLTQTGTSTWRFALYPPDHVFRMKSIEFIPKLPEGL